MTRMSCLLVGILCLYTTTILAIDLLGSANLSTHQATSRYNISTAGGGLQDEIPVPVPPAGFDFDFVWAYHAQVDCFALQSYILWLMTKYAQRDQHENLKHTTFTSKSIPDVLIELEVCEGAQFQVIHLLWGLLESLKHLKASRETLNALAMLTQISIGTEKLGVIGFGPRNVATTAGQAANTTDASWLRSTKDFCASNHAHTETEARLLTNLTSNAETAANGNLSTSGPDQAFEISVKQIPDATVLTAAEAFISLGLAVLSVLNVPASYGSFWVEIHDYHTKLTVTSPEERPQYSLPMLACQVMQRMISFTYGQGFVSDMIGTASKDGKAVQWVRFGRYPAPEVAQ